MLAVLHRIPIATQRGVGLIEVLIALVIFALGVVGMAGLQLRTMSVTMDTSQRSQVIAKSQDMADRIRSNGIAPAQYLGTLNTDGNYCETAPTSCEDVNGTEAGSCTVAEMVLFDQYDAFCSGEAVVDWQVDITCESTDTTGAMVPTTTCDAVGDTVVITTSWYARSLDDLTPAAAAAAAPAATAGAATPGATTPAASAAPAVVRDSMSLRFIP